MRECILEIKYIFGVSVRSLLEIFFTPLKYAYIASFTRDTSRNEYDLHVMCPLICPISSECGICLQITSRLNFPNSTEEKSFGCSQVVLCEYIDERMYGTKLTGSPQVCECA